MLAHYMLVIAGASCIKLFVCLLERHSLKQSVANTMLMAILFSFGCVFTESPFVHHRVYNLLHGVALGHGNRMDISGTWFERDRAYFC